MPVVAQAADALAGGSGWVGAGLLGLVLAWLLFMHLPAKDKQLTELLTTKDKQIADQRTEFIGSVMSLTTAFKAETQAERLACERHYETLASSMRDSLKLVGDQLRTHSERNQQWLETLKGEIETRKKEIEAERGKGT